MCLGRDWNVMKSLAHAFLKIMESRAPAVVRGLRAGGNMVEAISWLKRQLEFTDDTEKRDAIHRLPPTHTHTAGYEGGTASELRHFQLPYP